MSKASILIVFLTVLAQLRGQGGGGGTGTGAGTWGRYQVPIRTMSRLGTSPRPLLNAPSRLVTSNDSSLGGHDIPGGGHFRIMSTKPDVDLDEVINRHRAEMDSMVNGLMSAVSELPSPYSGMLTSPLSTSFSDPKPTTDPLTTSSFGTWDRRPNFSLTGDSSSPSVTSSSQSPPSTSEPAVTPPASRWRPRFSLKDDSPSPPRTSYSPPPPSPPPPSSPPSPPSPPSTPSPAPSTPYTPRRWPTIGTPPSRNTNSTPPASCSTSNDNATPSISQYRRPLFKRSETQPNNLTAEPNKMEPDPSSSPRTEPSPKPATPPAAPRKFYGSIGNQPSRKLSTSSNTERYNGSTTITDNLPKDGTIQIKISGRQIDDDRMFQMIKEARNAITAVFYGPLHTAALRGTISYRKREGL